MCILSPALPSRDKEYWRGVCISACLFPSRLRVSAEVLSLLSTLFFTGLLIISTWIIFDIFLAQYGNEHLSK